ncbi:hypothetical protein RJ40_01530 [Methanofollis aquaemaris]|uniref:Uncharacterized protein n=1 Tax=Methanofollis aquaemaris TaxID=126734 RepID=A0A8A3S3F0_9EURY|nr:hypothetical protein [Methanofollis aquaemaris]QSZ66271.1 hypothetical protein RJ40_01530 [Methanofollis aquaemaris]
MKKGQTLQDLKRLLPASLLAGLLGGGLIVFLKSYAYYWCWYDLLGLCHGIFFTIGYAHTLVLCFLTLFLTGMLAVALQQGEVGGQAQAVFAGGVSGCMAFFVIMVHTLVSDLLRDWVTDHVGFLIDSISYILVNFASTLFPALIVAAFATLGALLLFSSREKAATPEENARALRLVIGSTILIILVLLFLPPLVTHLMFSAGMIEAYPVWTFISLERTAPDTIVLAAHEVLPACALATPPYSVYIDGIDVSNASAAAASGLAVTVEPADGLQPFEGSQATWKGAVFEDNSTPVRVVVHRADGSASDLQIEYLKVRVSLN